jgi:hypothetical protein
VRHRGHGNAPNRIGHGLAGWHERCSRTQGRVAHFGGNRHGKRKAPGTARESSPTPLDGIRTHPARNDCRTGLRAASERLHHAARTRLRRGTKRRGTR